MGTTKRKMNPNSLANLIPNNQRTPEELRAMGHKGGTANGSKTVHWRLTIQLITTSGTWGRFAVLEAHPREAREGINRAVKKASFILDQELEKEFIALWKKKTGHKPRFV